MAVATARVDLEKLAPSLLDLIAENVDANIALLEPHEPYRVIWANAAMCRLTGLTKTAIVGRPWRALFPESDLHGIPPIFRCAAETGEPFRAEAFPYASEQFGKKYGLPGNMTYWDWKLLPAKDLDGRAAALLMIAHDVTEEKAWEFTRKRLEESISHINYLRDKDHALLRIQRAISSRLSLDAVLDLIVHSAMELMESDAAAVAMLNPNGRTFTLRVSESILIDRTPPEVFVVGRSAAGRVLETGEPLAIEDTREVTELKYLVLANGRPARAVALAPIRLDDRVTGAIGVHFMTPHAFSNEDIDLLASFAENAAVAIANARAYSQALAERRRLETILDTIPSGVLIIEGPEPRVVLMNRRAQELVQRPVELGMRAEEVVPTFRLLRPDGTPVWGPEGSPTYRAFKQGVRVSNEEVIVEHPDGKRITVLINAIPLRDEAGNVYGAIGVADDITAMKETQEALQRAYAHERHISETLQEALLPHVPRKIDGFTMASVYRPAQPEARVGGDFFDVFYISPGLTGVVIGDVSGKGIEAAVVTALTKYTLRGYAYEDPEPSLVLERLNHALCREGDVDNFVTAFYGLLDLRDQSLVFGNAGHEPPLHLDARTGRVTELMSGDMALGIAPDRRYSQCVIKLKSEDRVLLYTDGVTEARHGKRFFGFTRLKSVFKTAMEVPPDEFVERLIGDIIGLSKGYLHDDMAVLMLCTD